MDHNGWLRRVAAGREGRSWVLSRLLGDPVDAAARDPVTGLPPRGVLERFVDAHAAAHAPLPDQRRPAGPGASDPGASGRQAADPGASGRLAADPGAAGPGASGRQAAEPAASGRLAADPDDADPGTGGGAAASARPGRRIAVVVLDVDRFRQVNDAFGHHVGDLVLAELARRLSTGREPPGAQVVTRLGADRFAVAVAGLADAREARSVAARYAALLREPVDVDGLPVYLDASVGLAVHPDHGRDAGSLLPRAEAAMRDAKGRGDGRPGYPVGSDRRAATHLHLLADLRRALDDPADEGIRVYYQPQVDLRTGTVVGVEALLRWHHPVRGPVDPADVGHAAEHSPVMRRLTMRVIDEVVTELTRWAAAAATLRVSVNVGARDLLGGDLVDRLAGRLAERRVAPGRLQLEITAGALTSDPRAVLDSLARLRRLGVPVALDDFGTGYSSLMHLRRLPLAEVKIDRSFVLGMADRPPDAAVVRAVVALAEGLGLRVVAEGVENEPTWRALVECGCHVAQGWYCARPMPADELLAWLADYDRRARVPDRP